ncbi:hypothetical protein LCGC14_2516600, partial [marine sediment metagenome]
DRIEKQALSFFERTRARYLALANNDERIKTVNAGQSMELVHQDIIAVLEQFVKSNP